jgi:lipopolysaccharide export system permease protein
MILRRYVSISLIGPFLIGFGVVTFLLTLDTLLDLLDLLISKGIDPWTVCRLFLLALGWIMALSVPCGVLVSALMTYGRLSQDNEIIALRASGVHLMQVIAPALGMSVIVAVALTLFNNYILPDTNYAYAGLMQEIMRKRPTAEIRAGEMIDAFSGYNLWIGRLNDRTGEMQDVLILDGRSDPQSPRTIMARRGWMQYRPSENLLSLTLEDGEIHEANPSSPTGEYRRLHFQSQIMNITDTGDGWQGSSRHQRSQREMSVQAMAAQVQHLRRDLAHQDSLFTASLAEVPARTPQDLDRLDPGGQQGGLGRAWLAAFAWLGGHRARQHPPDVPPDTRRAIQMARSRQEEATNTRKEICSYQVEIHKKFSIPVACIVFVLVGAPLGMMARRGGVAAAFFSSAFFLFYYLCLVGGEQLADRLFLPPWLAMWISNMILGGLGIYLTARAIVSGQPARPRQRGAGA